MYSERIINSIKESRNGLDNMLNDHSLIKKIEFASTQIFETINQNSKIFSCGNGGSMCDAMPLRGLSGRFRENRRGLPAISISDPSFITCVANDFGFENIFSRFLEANAKRMIY